MAQILTICMRQVQFWEKPRKPKFRVWPFGFGSVRVFKNRTKIWFPHIPRIESMRSMHLATKPPRQVLPADFALKYCKLTCTLTQLHIVSAVMFAVVFRLLLLQHQLYDAWLTFSQRHDLTACCNSASRCILHFCKHDLAFLFVFSVGPQQTSPDLFETKHLSSTVLIIAEIITYIGMLFFFSLTNLIIKYVCCFADINANILCELSYVGIC